MNFSAAAFDYDGTLAHFGRMEKSTVDSLARLKETGCKLLLVSGRTLVDLQTVVDAYNMFDVIVAENGAVMSHSNILEGQLLTQPADRLLVEECAERGVQPLAVGRCVIATVTEHQSTVASIIDEPNLDYSITLNKEYAMALPAGIDKGSGLLAALTHLQIDPARSLAFGDAENDIAMFLRAGAGIAVSNSVDLLKENASWVTQQEHGLGVCEAIENVLTGRWH